MLGGKRYVGLMVSLLHRSDPPLFIVSWWDSGPEAELTRALPFHRTSLDAVACDDVQRLVSLWRRWRSRNGPRGQ